MAEILSKRAQIVENWEDFLNKYLAVCDQDEYHEKNNPNGYINLGTSVNNLCSEIVYSKVLDKDLWACDTSLLQYKEGYGILRLRKAMAALMTDFLELHERVNPENLFFASGATGCIDLLSHCLADPGDVFLVPAPFYSRIYTDCMQRSLVNIVPIQIISEDNTELFPVLTIEKLKKAYAKALLENHVVRGIFLHNPSNPLGDVYSPELLMEVLQFAYVKNLHVVVDEIYALSVFSDETEFHSALKFSTVPASNKLHVVYGMSKDFSIAGFRIGVIHTKCEKLQRCLKQLCFLQTISFPIMDIGARYLEDLAFCRSYVLMNRNRLKEKFKRCATRLQKMGLNVRNSEAGLFLWVDMRHICGSQSFDQETDFFDYLIEKFHLYIVPGKEFFCAQPGWFRIVFSAFPNHVDEGLNRLEQAIKRYKPICLPSKQHPEFLHETAAPRDSCNEGYQEGNEEEESHLK